MLYGQFCSFYFTSFTHSDTHQEETNWEETEDVKFLRNLAGHIGAEWEQLAAYLGIRPDEVDRIKDDYSRAEDRIFNLLYKWRRQQSYDYQQDLCRALVKSGRKDLAIKIQGIYYVSRNAFLHFRREQNVPLFYINNVRQVPILLSILLKG